MFGEEESRELRKEKGGKKEVEGKKGGRKEEETKEGEKVSSKLVRFGGQNVVTY